MQSRLTVSSFYQETTPQILIKLPTLVQGYFLPNAIYLVSDGQSPAIHKYCFENQSSLLTIPLPKSIGRYPRIRIKGIVEASKNIVCFIVEQQERLWFYHDNKVFQVQTHLASITALSQYGGIIYTGSKDMTVRLWKVNETGVVPDSEKHALFRHKGQINCFQGSGKLMLSGSSDKTIIVWEYNCFCSQKDFDSSVNIITTCDYSNQLVVSEANGTISIICGTMLRKTKKIVVNRLVQDCSIRKIVGLHEVDESFLWIVGRQYLEVGELNVGKVMAKINPNVGNIMAAKSLGSAILLTVAGKGVYMIKF